MEAVKNLGAIGPAARSVSPMLASFLTNEITAPPGNLASNDQNETDKLAERLKGSGRLPPKGPPGSEQFALSNDGIITWLPFATPRHSDSEQFVRSNIVERPNSRPPIRAVEPIALKLPPSPSVKTVTYGNTPIRMNVPTDRQFRDAVADALVKIGEISDATAPALEGMLQPEGPNRAALAVAMWQRNLEDSTAQRYIVATMRSDDWLHRMRAARLLGEAGTNAAVFLPELRRLLEDSELLVRKCATSAVERVSPPLP
jgi:hypothetical protein